MHGLSTPDHGPSAGDELKATDLLLPELTKAGMLAGGGRCLVLFFTRRSVENVTDTDTKVWVQTCVTNFFHLFCAKMNGKDIVLTMFASCAFLFRFP